MAQQIPATTTTGPIPLITPFVHEEVKRDGGGFVGYWLTNDAFTPTYCNPNSHWSISGNNCGCMPTTAVAFSIASACIGGSVLENPGLYTCPIEEPVCYTILYYTDDTDLNPKSGFGCYVEDFTQSLYAVTTVTGVSSPNATETGPAAASSAISSFGATNLPKNTQTTTGQGGSSTGSSNGKSSSSGPSAGLIAGATIGSVAVLAIVVGVVFWIWYLRKKMKKDQAAAGATSQTPPPVQYMYIPQQQVYHQQVQPPQELEGHKPVEMQGGDTRPELGQ